MTYDLIFDAILGLTLVWISWRVLASPELFKAVVLFIVYGLLMALAWTRLQAPDVALAEAAIGAGLTGALMLDAVGQMTGRAFPYFRSDQNQREGTHEQS